MNRWRCIKIIKVFLIDVSVFSLIKYIFFYLVNNPLIHFKCVLNSLTILSYFDQIYETIIDKF